MSTNEAQTNVVPPSHGSHRMRRATLSWAVRRRRSIVFVTVGLLVMFLLLFCPLNQEPDQFDYALLSQYRWAEYLDLQQCVALIAKLQDGPTEEAVVTHPLSKSEMPAEKRVILRYLVESEPDLLHGEEAIKIGPLRQSLQTRLNYLRTAFDQIEEAVRVTAGELPLAKANEGEDNQTTALDLANGGNVAAKCLSATIGALIATYLGFLQRTRRASIQSSRKCST